MRKRALLILAFGLSATVLWGCGGGGSGPGSPGSQGSEDTGVALSAAVQPRYLDADTESVDVVRQDDCDGKPDTIDPEPFTTHSAIFTFTGRLVNPETTFPVGDIVIEKYQIQYRASQDSIGAPPIEQAEVTRTMLIRAPSGSNVVTVQDSGVFVDLVRKDRYLQDILSGQYSSSAALINNYTAVYTFTGQNTLGKDVTIVAQRNFEIGSFDNCKQQQ